MANNKTLSRTIKEYRLILLLNYQYFKFDILKFILQHGGFTK